MEEPKNVEEAIMCHHVWIKWSAVLFFSWPSIFQAATLVMSHLNYECEKCVHFYDCNIRWLCWSASSVIGSHVLMEAVIHFNWYNLKNVPEEENKDWKGQDSAFISEAADQFRSFGAPVKSNTFDTSPALLAPTVTSVSSVLSSSEN